MVIATQAPIIDPALLSNRCTPKQSYCLAARSPAPSPTGMYLSCDDATRSLRPAVRSTATRSSSSAAPATTWATPPPPPSAGTSSPPGPREHFGPVEVTHRWATHDLVPTDHVPFIGRLAPRRDRRWVATGFAKWGMTNAYVAAHLLTAAIAGDDRRLGRTFDATRIRAHPQPRDRSPSGPPPPATCSLDRVTRRREPRCTHQGCVLRADTALGTWDCPCHGSRFAADGTVVQGPAKAPVDVT